ncbi:MAG: LysM peptidoglycan-binding domain-containing protein [Clostridiaceae bacterium]|nr:LysM peptidoglycan-binding domain-containing protein [Clostridiaceae bacterium]
MKIFNGRVKGKFSKILALTLALLLVLGLQVAMVSADEITGDLSGKLVILHTNDTHGGDVAAEGQSIGTAGVAQLVKDYEARGAEVLLVSAGDAIQGDPLVNLNKGLNAILFMNEAGYDLMVPGNHEFDFGFDNLKELEQKAKFPIISSNILDKETGAPVFKENIVIETTVGKIGIFGLTSPETLTKANPKNVASLHFPAGEELYEIARQQVKKLTEAGADYIICVAHLGIDNESEPNRSIDVIENVDGIDVVIDGHSHSVIEGDKYGNTILVSAGTKLSHVGVVTIDKDGITTKLISASDYSSVDSLVNEFIAIEAAKIDEMLSEKFAVTEVFLDGNRDPGVRTKETNLGNFAADAILWAANNAVGGGVDIAITNGGGIRASIQIGNVTMKDMKTVFPFGNTVAIVEVTGAQLLELLEASTCSTPVAIGAFPQVSGIEFTIDTTVPYENGAQYPDSTYYAPANPGARIKNVKINGEPLDLNKTYTLATNDFLAAGGDTYYLLKNLSSYNTGVALEDALINYTSEVLNGVISEEMYGAPKGNITILTAPASENTETEDETPEAEEQYIYYKVVKGDCLWNIAKKYLGSGTRYMEIYNLNKDILKSPDRIYIGQVLKIPA